MESRKQESVSELPGSGALLYEFRGNFYAGCLDAIAAIDNGILLGPPLFDPLADAQAAILFMISHGHPQRLHSPLTNQDISHFPTQKKSYTSMRPALLATRISRRLGRTRKCVVAPLDDWVVSF